MLSLGRLFKSFVDAGRGLEYAFRNEQNFRLQLLAALAALLLAIYFPLRTWEIILVILLIISVLTMEILNTVVEKFSDLLMPRLHHYVLVIKDLMAAATLLTSLGAAVIGTIIFLPHFLALVK